MNNGEQGGKSGGRKTHEGGRAGFEGASGRGGNLRERAFAPASCLLYLTLFAVTHG